MASNFPCEQTEVVAIEWWDDTVSKTSDEGYTGSRQLEEKVKHRFSEPWEDSDVILVAEDEKFHVHRLILSLNSPVFKAMFKSQFKEATANEIPLPGKKANEMLDFLKQFYLQEQQEITMESVECLLKLSDEYQVKVTFDSSVRFLKNQQITNKNVMRILKLASVYKLEDVRESCYNTIKEMKLQSILKASRQEQDLDKETMENMLARRIERLENFLDRLYVDFIELINRSFRLWSAAKKDMKWCPHHFDKAGRIVSSSEIAKFIKECKVCREMLVTLESDKTYYPFKFLGDCLSLKIEEFSGLIRVMRQ